MRTIESTIITDAVAALCEPAATKLPTDVLRALEKGRDTEASALGKSILDQVVENAIISKTEVRPLCQDTGYAVLFVELGNQVFITGQTLDEACNEGIRRGYDQGFLRK